MRFISIILYTVAALALLPIASKSQTVKFNAYMDIYYDWDNDQKVHANGDRSLTFLNERKNETDVNIVQIGATIEDTSWHGKFTLHSGRLPAVAAAGSEWHFLQEAWAGLRIMPDLWLDAGVFLTHIGAEALTPRDNFMALHSVMTSYQPFYQAGARLVYSKKDYEIQALFLNGYGRFEDNNDDKSLGWLFSYKGIEDITISYNGVLGNEQDFGNPVNTRFFNDIVVNASVAKGTDLRFLADYCREIRAGIYAAHCYGGAVQIRQSLGAGFACAMRGEIFHDPDNILGSGGVSSLSGLAAGLEYKASEKTYLRAETRMLNVSSASSVYFAADNLQRSDRRFEIALNMGVWF
jgi:hypothetical protein